MTGRLSKAGPPDEYPGVLPVPRAGDFGLVITRQPMSFLLETALRLNGDPSKYTHAVVALDRGLCVEAAPFGARVVLQSKYTGRVLWSTDHLPSTVQPTPDTAALERVADAAAALCGTPYSFLDYVALALIRYAGGSGWLGRYLQSREHMICSQICDAAYLRAGVHLFDDGRLSQDVTPGDLARLVGADAR